MKNTLPIVAVSVVVAALAPRSGHGHEGFLPLHHHSSSHDHSGHAPAVYTHAEVDGGGAPVAPALGEERFALATGTRFTRYSVEGEKAHLWETGLGIDFAVLPWLHVGGDVAYGWFESEHAKVDGWLAPHAHVDLHLPLGGPWEMVAGLESGFPGGEEALVGEHWEWAPHLELRYDRGGWFVEADVSVAFIAGEGGHHHHEADADASGEEDHGAEEAGEAHDDEHAHELEPAHERDIAGIVEPHGERELRYSLAAGIRLFDERLTIESRVSGIHILSGDTGEEDYLRAGLRASWEFDRYILLTTEGSVPLTDAERNQWQVSVGVRVGF